MAKNLFFREYPHNSYGQKYGTNVPPCIGYTCSNSNTLGLVENLTEQCENHRSMARGSNTPWRLPEGFFSGYGSKACYILLPFGEHENHC